MMNEEQEISIAERSRLASFLSGMFLHGGTFTRVNLLAAGLPADSTVPDSVFRVVRLVNEARIEGVQQTFTLRTCRPVITERITNTTRSMVHPYTPERARSIADSYPSASDAELAATLRAYADQAEREEEIRGEVSVLQEEANALHDELENLRAWRATQTEYQGRLEHERNELLAESLRLRDRNADLRSDRNAFSKTIAQIAKATDCPAGSATLTHVENVMRELGDLRLLDKTLTQENAQLRIERDAYKAAVKEPDREEQRAIPAGLETLAGLDVGDIVRNVLSRNAVTILANYGEYCFAVRHQHISNPREWMLVSKARRD